MSVEDTQTRESDKVPKAIIVAAGTATRMRPLTERTPKCLLPVAGTPMLERIIHHLLAVGVHEIGIVVGYRREMIRAFLRNRFPFATIHFCVNPRFESTNNAFSLLMTREFYMQEEKRNTPLRPMLLLDSDLVFTNDLLPLILEDRTSNRIAVRVGGVHDDEEMRVAVNGQREVVAISKQVPLAEALGESVGVEYLLPSTARRLFEILEQRVQLGPGREEFYEAAFQELIDSGERFAAVDVSRCPVAEVDTPDDLAEAGRMLKDLP